MSDPPSKTKKARVCLICAESTRAAHLGMDVCRACAVFYRRYHTKTDFVCRAGNDNCSTGKGLKCKRCRLAHISALLSETISVSNIDSIGPSTFKPRARTVNQAPSSCSLIAKLKSAMNTMNYARLCSETYARKDAPHPLRISLEAGPFFSGDFATQELGNKILLSTALNFGAEVFPEFAALSEKEKWNMVMNFFYRFRPFEGCYRANAIFPEEPDRYFSCFAGWISEETKDECWPCTSGDLASAKTSVSGYMESYDFSKQLREARQALARVNPCHEEFLAITTLMFFDEVNANEEIRQIGEKYRNIILEELHAFYRKELKLDNYAARLGELMMLLQVFDKKKDLKEHHEVLRLFNVLPEDDFVYGLQRTV